MQLEEVRSIAKLHSIKPDHLSKSELIKTIQTKKTTATTLLPPIAVERSVRLSLA